MKYYIIAGEASGDLHGSNLMQQLLAVDSTAEFRFWGGDKMAAVAPGLVKHYKQTAVMGILPVLFNLRTILQNIRFCIHDVLQWIPDVLILIDYPGFNLKIANAVHPKGVKVFYYISPKIWAWKESRIKHIKSSVDKMFLIFPFEIDFYKKHQYHAEYVGNPLLDEISAFQSRYDTIEQFKIENGLSDKPIVALVPGSRKQEILQVLPVMLQVQKAFCEYQFVVAGAPSIDDEIYKKAIRGYDVPILRDKTYELLNYSTAALVTSGTATLEAGLFNVPQVVCYKFKGGSLVYNLGRWLFLKVPYVSLVNIVLGKEAVKELLQQHLTPANLKRELDKILHEETYRQQMLQDYLKMHVIMGEKGASERAAKKMYNALKQVS